MRSYQLDAGISNYVEGLAGAEVEVKRNGWQLICNDCFA